MTCVPRRLSANDSYLWVAIEVSLDGTNRELKLETVVGTGYVKPNYLNGSHPLTAIHLLNLDARALPEGFHEFDRLAVPKYCWFSSSRFSQSRYHGM